MSSPLWDSIPLLALKCILENLKEKDALAATSTCRHWRSGMLMYEGRRDLLKLPVKHLQRCDHLVRLFKKHVRRLHILIGANASEELQTLMRYILPQFLDSINLREIVFVGPVYTNLSGMMPISPLRRVITETLVFKHAHVLEKLAVIGCNLSVLDEDDRFVNSQMEYHSKSLCFEAGSSSSEDLILSRKNVNMMTFCNVKHIVFEYEQISTEALITLANLENLKLISLNFTSRKGMVLPIVEWSIVKPYFPRRLDIAVNLIHLSEERLEEIMEKALSPDMPVTSLKALFLKDFYMGLILHVAQAYGSILEEFIWADPPTPTTECKRLIRTASDEHSDTPYGHVNPFIYLAWQCRKLRRLDIHGYWICEYDLLGVTRLRTGLQLNASSIFDSTLPLFENPPDVGGGNVLRVMTSDDPPRIQPVNKNIYRGQLNDAQTRQLTPKNWDDLHPGLRVGSTRAQRTDYIVGEVLNPLISH